MWGLLKVQVFGLQLLVGDGMSAPLTIRPEILLHGILGVGQRGMEDGRSLELVPGVHEGFVDGSAGNEGA